MSTGYDILSALIIDDKVEVIDNTSGNVPDRDVSEYKYLREIQNFFTFNNIPLYVLTQIGDQPVEAIDKLKNFPPIDLMILDLDYNNNGDFDEYDKSILLRVLKEAKSSFKTFSIMIYSSIGDNDTWNAIKNDIIKDDPSMEDLLSENNVQLVIKGDSEKNEKLFEAVSNSLIERKKASVLIQLNEQISLTKYWKTEWIFIGLGIFVLLTVLLFYVQIKSILLIVTTYLILVILFCKLILLEKNTIARLMEAIKKRNEK